MTDERKPSLSIIKYHYEHHLELFKHSDEFVQNRTSQFSMMNAILFAFFGVIAALVSTPEERHGALFILAFSITALGLVVSYVWFCSYKRSVGYRRIHRDTLHQLDKILKKEYGHQLDDSDPIQFALQGPFQIRHKIMYEKKTMPYSSSGKVFEVGKMDSKKELFNVESIPLFSMVLWGVCVAVTAYIFFNWM